MRMMIMIFLVALSAQASTGSFAIRISLDSKSVVLKSKNGACTLNDRPIAGGSCAQIIATYAKVLSGRTPQAPINREEPSAEVTFTSEEKTLRRVVSLPQHESCDLQMHCSLEQSETQKLVSDILKLAH